MKIKLIFLSAVLFGFSLAQANVFDNALEKNGVKRMTTIDTLLKKASNFKDSVGNLCHEALNNPDVYKGASATGALVFGVIGSLYSVKALISFFDKEEQKKRPYFPMKPTFESVVCAVAFLGSAVFLADNALS